MIISPEDIKRFQEDGAVVLRKVFDPHWIQLVKQGIRLNLEEPSCYSQSLQGSPKSGIYFNDYCNWRRIPEFQEYVQYSPAAAIVGKLLSSKWIKFYHEHVLVKEPGTEKETPWHQDQPYYPIDGHKVCSIWMPIDTVSMTCSLRLIRGSHLWNRWFVPRMFASSKDYPVIRSNDRQYESLDPSEFDSMPNEILQWEVQPGDCVVFHMQSIHGALGNTSSCDQRRVLATRWLGDDVKLVTRPWKESPPNEAAFFTGTAKPNIEDLPTVWSESNLS